ncbi:MAG: glutamate--tRNA ligase family protein [bacterium]|nr:glutamate--tRNA ligase family protein [bacterium]
MVVRFPPSPTGELHIGNIRTLLFNYLFARHHGGEIVMRFEDTDRERSKKEYEESALYTLKALGLDFDKGPFRQSERGERYAEAIDTLLKSGAAYEGEQSRSTSSGQANDGSGENVIRLKNPNREVTFNDAIRGGITIDTTDFGDFVIARSKQSPVYHLTVVVDDMDIGVTHVIRGEDHITSTPRQMLLIEALGGTMPQYAHLPLIVGEDKKKLGKRHGATTYREFERMGIVPEALVNYLALLGWNPGDEREIFSKDELVKEFSLERVGKSPAMFSYEKLASINYQYMLKMDEAEYAKRVLDVLHNMQETPVAEDIAKFIVQNEKRGGTLVKNVIKERANMFGDIPAMVEKGEFVWVFGAGDYTTEKLVWKDSSHEETLGFLQAVYDMLKEVEESAFSTENIKGVLWEFATKEGRGAVLWPLRYALTGMEKSPDPFTVAEILGKEETLKRLKDATAKL